MGNAACGGGDPIPGLSGEESAVYDPKLAGFWSKGECPNHNSGGNAAWCGGMGAPKCAATVKVDASVCPSGEAVLNFTKMIPFLRPPEPESACTSFAGEYGHSRGSDISTIVQSDCSLTVTNPQQSWSPVAGSADQDSLDIFEAHGIKGKKGVDHHKRPAILWTNGAIWDAKESVSID